MFLPVSGPNILMPEVIYVFYPYSNKKLNALNIELSSLKMQIPIGFVNNHQRNLSINHGNSYSVKSVIKVQVNDYCRKPILLNIRIFPAFATYSVLLCMTCATLSCKGSQMFYVQPGITHNYYIAFPLHLTFQSNFINKVKPR